MPGSLEHPRPRPWQRPGVRLASLIAALVVLLAMGVDAYLTEADVEASQKWVVHTYTVKASLQKLQTEVSDEQVRAEVYLHSNPVRESLEQQQAEDGIPQSLDEIQTLTSDNRGQQDRLRRLKELFAQRTGLESSDSKEFEARQTKINALIHEMVNEEDSLLNTRLSRWHAVFNRNLIILVAALAAALFLLVYNFRLLQAEVRSNKEVARLQRENAESYRLLSARILGMQDMERRRIARELHDSVGQFLAGLKMNLQRLAALNVTAGPDQLELFGETVDLTDRAIKEVRTISHLLHPPLLDEMGLEAAAKWYAEGYAKRTGIPVSVKAPNLEQRFPKEVELALFRVLQETLTNVHRHAQAKSVEIELTCAKGDVILQVRDDGNGVPPAILRRFEAGIAAGIGLAGMRERVAELGGQLQVESRGRGTTVRVKLSTSEGEIGRRTREASDVEPNQLGMSVKI